MIKEIPLAMPSFTDPSRGHGPLPASAPRGVLLDIDGTLLDSNGAHARSWLEALLGEGIALPYESVRRQIGKGGEKLLWSLLKIDGESVKAQTISRHRRDIFKRSYLPDLKAFPGTRELLLQMRRSGLSLHVATSASEEEVTSLLTAAGVSDLIHSTATKDDAERSKPDPDIVNAAVKKSELPRADLIMLGDTPYDVEAGTRAGVPVVAVRSGGWGDRDLIGAIAIYDDAADLLAHWNESPFVVRSSEGAAAAS